MDMQSNPFSPGAGMPPPCLVGRDALVEEVSGRFARLVDRSEGSGGTGKGILLTGLRGVGKTVLLGRFAQDAEDLGCSVASLEASPGASVKHLLGRELRSHIARLHRRSGPTEVMRRALSLFKSFSLSVGLDGSIGFSVDVSPAYGEADSGDTEIDLRELLSALGKAYRENGGALVIVIDEMQYLSRDELGGIIGAYHRVAQLRLPIGIVGAGLPDLPGLAGNAKTYAERLFRFPELGRLSREEVESAVNMPSAQHQVRFTDDAIDDIWQASDGYPYYVQEWAHESWAVAPGPTITKDDVQHATDRVIARLDSDFFRVRAGRVGASERHYLRSMAELGPGPHASGAIAHVFGASVQRVAPVRQSLIEKGMLYSPELGLTAFSVPLFDGFMTRTFSLEQTHREVVSRERGPRRTR